MKEERYTITLNKKQLELLSQASEFMARFCCGQIERSTWPSQASVEYYKSRGKEFDEWIDKRNEVDELMTKVKKVWWEL